MKKTKRILTSVLGLAMVGILCFFLGTISSGPSEKMSAVVLENKLTEIKELATVTYTYTNMAQFESNKEFYGMKLPFTTKKFILSYDGEIKAGIDLSNAEISLIGKKVTITLPNAKILSHEIDEESIKIFDESKSIFNPFSIKDYNSFRSDQKIEMEKRAESRGLLVEAREKSKETVKSLLRATLPEDYNVIIK
jgi:hypothetical protein